MTRRRGGRRTSPIGPWTRGPPGTAPSRPRMAAARRRCRCPRPARCRGARPRGSRRRRRRRRGPLRRRRGRGLVVGAALRRRRRRRGRRRRPRRHGEQVRGRGVARVAPRRGVELVLARHVARVHGGPGRELAAELGERRGLHAAAVRAHDLGAALLHEPRALGRRARLAADAQAAPRLAGDRRRRRARGRRARLPQRLERERALLLPDLRVVARRPPDLVAQLARRRLDGVRRRAGLRELEARRPVRGGLAGLRAAPAFRTLDQSDRVASRSEAMSLRRASVSAISSRRRGAAKGNNGLQVSSESTRTARDAALAKRCC